MDKREIDEVLARELAKVGEEGANLAGALTGEHIAGFAPSAGAAFAARFLPSERYQVEVKLRVDARSALEAAAAILRQDGHLEDGIAAQESAIPTLYGVIRSGAFNLNRTHVCVQIRRIDTDGCSLLITAAAKEGLIKQRAAEKALTRIVKALSTS